MDSTRQQSSSLELWLPEVQSYIAKVTYEPMKRSGFEFSKSRFCYKRKNKKSQDELSIIFLSHFPVNYQIGIQLEISHPQLKHVKESFMKQIVNKESDTCSIILHLKDFPSRDPDQQMVKNYSISNHRDLFMVGDWLAQTLQYDLVPMCDQMSTVEHMDSFFESKPDWSLNTRSGGNICTDLITAKLNKRRNYHERFLHLNNALLEKIENRQINPESRQLLSLCYDYLK